MFDVLTYINKYKSNTKTLKAPTIPHTPHLPPLFITPKLLHPTLKHPTNCTLKILEDQRKLS
jgi:hypothetical protein